MKLICLLILFTGLCHGVSKAAYCTAQGRFPNKDVEDCRGFTMCLVGGASNFTQYSLTCPIGFVYSHLEQQCTNATNYQCLPTYNCTTAGNFEISPNTNCSSHIACVEGISDIVTARLILCPPNTVFSPIEGTCINNTEYKCIRNTEENNELIGVELNTDIFNFSSNVTFNNAASLGVQFMRNFSIIFLVLYSN